MTPDIEREESLHFDTLFFHTQIEKVIHSLLPTFDAFIKRYVWFHLFFLVLGIIEIVSLLFFFSFLVHSALFSFALTALFLTCMIYFVMRLYFQTKKENNFHKLCEQYIDLSKRVIHYQSTSPESFISLSNACSKFADKIQGREFNYWKPFRYFEFLQSSTQRFSYFWHWEDIFQMREMLYHKSIDEYIKLVKEEPSSLEAHASLANAYVTLSGIYVETRKRQDDEEEWQIPSKKMKATLDQKFRNTAKRAIEEFKILKDFAPDNPWVHAQLAYSYHDLNMPEKEIEEYETISRLSPEDKDILYKLGILYFQHGRTAEGLGVYERLKRANFKKAESLLTYYDSVQL